MPLLSVGAEAEETPMKPRKSTYLIHRWLGLIVSLQLLAWSVGGFMFSVLEIENVRGERDIGAEQFEPLSQHVITELPASIQSSIQSLSSAHSNLATVALIDRGIGPSWEIRSTSGELLARLDHESGESLPIISEQDARLVAERDFAHPAPIKKVQLIESKPPVEFRNGVLPAYRVEIHHPKQPRLYIDARTGQVVSRRNRLWRVFDFFWMLHTMDYGGRDDFNHPLLTGFSVLAIATSASGVTLWGWRAGSRLRRKRNPGPA